jgi:hypothetical protein
VKTPALLGALAGVWALVACGSAIPDADGARPPAAGSKTVPYSVVKRGTIPDRGRAGSPRGRLVRDRAGAARILRAWDLERALPAARSLDYARKSLIIVLAGSVPDTAYSLAVRRVSIRSQRIEVQAAVRRPAGAVGGMAISRPYALLSVDRDDAAGADGTVSVRISTP